MSPSVGCPHCQSPTPATLTGPNASCPRCGARLTTSTTAPRRSDPGPILRAAPFAPPSLPVPTSAPRRAARPSSKATVPVGVKPSTSSSPAPAPTPANRALPLVAVAGGGLLVICVAVGLVIYCLSGDSPDPAPP